MSKELIKNIKQELLNEGKKIQNIEIDKILKKSIWEYWMYINYNRSFEEIKDWLKPVWRRLLYSMYEQWLKYWWAYKKSANVVWYCMGNFHPHWDSYWTLVYISQDFSLRYPLWDPQGNFGSITWSWPAASRYTEIRPSIYTQELLFDNLNEISKDTFFKQNFSWEKLEPIVLPAKLPFSLLNWTTWIWVWTSTKTVPHYSKEVIKSLIKLIQNNEYDISKIMNPESILYNDIIISKEDKENIYLKNWKWKIIYRWKYEIIKNKNKQIIRIISLPLEETVDKFIDKLNKAIKDKKITEIKKAKMIWMNYDKNKVLNLNIELEIDKNSSINVLINKLYKYTNFESSFNVSYTFIDWDEIVDLSIKDILLKHINFRRKILLNIFENRIKKLNRELLVNEAKLLALNNIEEVIKIITKAKSDEEILTKFEKKLWIKKEYWEIILEIKLRNIKKLDKEQIKNKIKEIKEKIKYYNELINNREKLNEYMINELKEIEKKIFKNDIRRGEVIELNSTNEKNKREILSNNEKEHYQNYDVTLFITNKWNIIKTKNEWKLKIKKKFLSDWEYYLSTFNVKNKDNLLLILSNWKFYKLDTLYKLELDKKLNISSILNKNISENIIWIITEDNLKDSLWEYLVFDINWKISKKEVKIEDFNLNKLDELEYKNLKNWTKLFSIKNWLKLYKINNEIIGKNLIMLWNWNLIRIKLSNEFINELTSKFKTFIKTDKLLSAEINIKDEKELVIHLKNEKLKTKIENIKLVSWPSKWLKIKWFNLSEFIYLELR